MTRCTCNGENCARCGARPRKPGQGYCKECHAEYMREWRAKRARPKADPWQALAAKHASS